MPMHDYFSCGTFAKTRQPFVGTVMPKGDALHVCPKPDAWAEWLVTRAAQDDEVVLDPFMGSGTTGVACVRLGRAFVGIEIDPGYFRIACRRIDEAFDALALFDPVPPATQTELPL